MSDFLNPSLEEVMSENYESNPLHDRVASSIESKELLPIQGSSIYYITRSGRVCNSLGHVLRSYDSRGYRSIKLRLTPGGKRKSHLIHRLVYEAFVGPIPPTYQINHIDGVKHNNDISNLEAVTCSENHLHASQVLKRRYLRGSECPLGKLTDEAVEIIRLLHPQGYSQHYLAKAFNVSQPSISNIINNKTFQVLS